MSTTMFLLVILMRGAYIIYRELLYNHWYKPLKQTVVYFILYVRGIVQFINSDMFI